MKILPREDYAMHEERVAKLRPLVVKVVKEKIPVKDVAILLSGGVDSHMALFSALKAGKRVTCYSFTLDDRISSDSRIAEETAAIFGLPFVRVRVPTDFASMESYLKRLYYEYRLYEGFDMKPIKLEKSTIETIYPMYYAIKAMAEDGFTHSLGGFWGDRFFALVRSDKKKLDTYQKDIMEPARDIITSGAVVPQHFLWGSIAKCNGYKHLVQDLFNDIRVFDIFKNMHPMKEGNKPMQKAPYRLCYFDEFHQTTVRVHQSYQKGDTGISDLFPKLLLPSYLNKRSAKSVQSIYNDLNQEHLDHLASIN